MNARFSVGIDLGTSNSAIAVGDIESGDTKIFEIEQIVGPNQLGELPTLPSATSDRRASPIAFDQRRLFDHNPAHRSG